MRLNAGCAPLACTPHVGVSASRPGLPEGGHMAKKKDKKKKGKKKK